MKKYQLKALSLAIISSATITACGGGSVTPTIPDTSSTATPLTTATSTPATATATPVTATATPVTATATPVTATATPVTATATPVTATATPVTATAIPVTATTIPTAICDAPEAWDEGTDWTEYTIGDLRSDNGKVWEVTNTAYAIYQPSGASGHFGWKEVDSGCSTEPTATSVPTTTEVPTATAIPTTTAVPTATAIPTATTVPTLATGLCAGYENWSGGATKGGVTVVYENIAYTAKYETSTTPGGDEWDWTVNCDGTPKGSAPYLSLPSANDPVVLKIDGWPSDMVVSSPSSSSATAPAIIALDTINTGDLSDQAKLTSALEAMIQSAKSAGSSSVTLDGSLLSASGSISVKQALTAAVSSTGSSSISASDIDALTDDVVGLAQAHNVIFTKLAPNATFGWTLPIEGFSGIVHSGNRAIWNAQSKASAKLLDDASIYKGASKADFVAFTVASSQANLTDDEWHNALRYVKQVTDFVQSPALLSSVPTAEAADYFMGDTAADRKLRHTAFNNVFSVNFDTDSAALTTHINAYKTAAIPLYYTGAIAGSSPLTAITGLNSELASVEDTMNTDVFRYEIDTNVWGPSTIYKWADFLTGLNSMHNIGVAGDTFWLVDDSANDETNSKYAKVAIAAFLSQTMQETIRYDACDENNWSDARYADIAYPMTASCGQLGQVYGDYGINPDTGRDHAYSCPQDTKQELTALTHAKWYGAPGPIFAVPDAVLEEQGKLVNGNVGQWNIGGSWCGDIATAVDTSKHAFERDDCKVYVGQKDGKYEWNGQDTGSVEGCGWWGRGVIQTTGRQNFGTLNHFVGRSHVDPDTIGTTIDNQFVAQAPESPLYADLDLCSNPGLICSSEEHKEIKWIAGLFFWVSSVQAYENEGGPYEGWDYYAELKKYVDDGMVGTEFVDAVSGIVNRGCPDDHCPVSGEVHAIEERRAGFKLVLQKLGLNPQ